MLYRFDIIQLMDLMDIKYFTLIWLWYLFNKIENYLCALKNFHSATVNNKFKASDEMELASFQMLQ
jgi:hypothetical protein